MFARSILRTTAPLKRNVRSYASQAPAGGMGALGYSAIGAAVLGGGYYYYANIQGKAPQIPVPTSTKDTSSNPSSQDTQRGASVPASADAKAFMGGDQGFVPLVLEKVEDVSHNTKKFYFKFDDPNKTSGLSITSAVITKFQEEGQKPVIRPYTPVSDEDQKGYLTFVIKHYPNGPMTTHIHNMKVGDSLLIKGPIPKYPWSANKHSHVALIAGGTGITPMWQLARAIFKNPEDKTKVTLLFGNLTEDDILLRKEWEDLEKQYPGRMRAFYLLDNPPEGWKQGKGHITKELLQKVLPAPDEENVKVFVCGPPGLYKAVSGTKKSPSDQGELDGYLKELGYGKDQVYKF